jgi:hypothetical protein
MRISRFSRNRRRTLSIGALIVVLAIAAIVSLPSQQPEAGGPDTDRDGLTNRFELKRSHTNPRKADTDGDRLRDRFELKRSHTNPRKSDTDADGLSDRVELRKLRTNPRRKETGCMSRPSACGFPDIESVGVKTPASQLRVVNRNVTLSTEGQVYENKDVKGCITVGAPNITIRNVKVTCRGFYPIRAFDHPGVVIEDVEVDMGGNLSTGGVEASQVRRTFVHNGSDCGGFNQDQVYEDNLCSLGPDANDDGWADSDGFCSGSGAHFDGYQSGSVVQNVTIRHNTIRNPCSQTSAILVGYIEAPSSDIVIDRNLVAGGGYTIYCDQNHISDVTFTSNRFATTFFRRAGYYGPTAACGGSNVKASGNLWDDTGAPLPRRRARGHGRSRR